MKKPFSRTTLKVHHRYPMLTITDANAAFSHEYIEWEEGQEFIAYEDALTLSVAEDFVAPEIKVTVAPDDSVVLPEGYALLYQSPFNLPSGTLVLSEIEDLVPPADFDTSVSLEPGQYLMAIYGKADRAERNSLLILLKPSKAFDLSRVLVLYENGDIYELYEFIEDAESHLEVYDIDEYEAWTATGSRLEFSAEGYQVVIKASADDVDYSKETEAAVRRYAKRLQTSRGPEKLGISDVENASYADIVNALLDPPPIPKMSLREYFLPERFQKKRT